LGGLGSGGVRGRELRPVRKREKREPPERPRKKVGLGGRGKGKTNRREGGRWGIG